MNKISDNANRKFDETGKSLYPDNFSREKEQVQKRNLDLKRSLEERRRRKWCKFQHNALNVRQQKMERLISKLMEEALHKHKSNSNNRISSSRKKKKGVIFEQPDVPGKRESELSSVTLIERSKIKYTFQSETRNLLSRIF